MKPPVAGDALRMVPPGELRTAEPFKGLFPIDPAILDSVRLSMDDRGFDESKPIEVWLEEMVVVDGHTRLKAAKAAGLDLVPVFYLSFDDEDAALKYAIANQRNRRNITSADITRLVMAVDKRKRNGGNRGNQYTPATISRETLADPYVSAEETAEFVGTSRGTVNRVRALVDHAKVDPLPLQDVLQGKRGVKSAAADVYAAKGKSKRKPADPAIPPARPRSAPPRQSGSVVRVSAEDQKWLESLPLRSRVVAHRFDEDALIYRHFREVMGGVEPTLIDLVGRRTGPGMSLLYRLIFPLAKVLPVERWCVCPACGGSGRRGGTCRKCHGGGYLIS
jgi:hypothetical protein